VKEIKLDAGFTSNIKADDALAIALFGEQGSGKTRFGITMPDPIGVIALDRKTRKTVERIAKELDKTVVMPTEDFIRVAKPMQLALLKPSCGANIESKLDDKTPKMCCAIHYYRWHVNRIKSAALKLYEHRDIKSILMDTGTQLWEDILFAHFGRNERIMPRDRGPANQEMIDFLNCLSGKHLTITHKAKQVWKNDKPTDKYEWQGFPHLGYHTNVIAELVCDDGKGMDDEGRFYMNVHMCQDNPDIQGPGGKKILKDDSVNFPMLAYSVYPDVDVDEWM
jgi:hypothetical protein